MTRMDRFLGNPVNVHARLAFIFVVASYFLPFFNLFLLSPIV